MASVATLKRMSREQLSSLLLSTDASKVAVIDVRDHDHIGGHIKSSTHIPSSSLDHQTPSIVRTMAGKEIVVFHCALSQQRGPAAALRYMRERETKMKSGKLDTKHGLEGVGIKDGPVQKVSTPVSKEQEVRGENERVLDAPQIGVENGSIVTRPPPEPKEQEIYVLDRGFVGWQEKYGKDERLTEAYAEDLWADY